ncbi:MAG: glycosyltransferase family 39 protein [Clostridia bacterium]|nr:glycosyltransferase family 39 protein [Clostridia bacterium]
MKKIPAYLIMILLFIGLHLPAFAETANIMVNPGFEEGEAFWTKHSWENKGVFYSDASQKHSGNSSVCIVNDIPSDSRYKQTVVAKENSYYKLSCWVKTENVGSQGKGANLSIDGLLVTSNDVKGSVNDWQHIELYGKTGQSQSGFVLTIGLGGYGMLNTGKAWFDDVSVQMLDSLPSGVTAVNLFNESDTSSNQVQGAVNEKSKGTSLFIIVISVLFLLIIGICFFVLRANKSKGNATPHNQYAGEDNVKNGLTKTRFDKKDIIIMSSMTLIYLAIALYNLGGFNAPNTSWQPSRPGENFIVDLGKVADISKIYYYNGIYQRTYENGSYRVEYLDAAGKFIPLTTIEKKDFYVWKYIDVSAKTSKLRITVESPSGVLNELGIFEAGSSEPIKGIEVLEKNVDQADKGTVENLFDEQDTIEYSPSFMTGTYFDEIYHARTAYEHLKQMAPYETTHPPLGKVLISIGIAIFGMNPFGWRIIGTLFGAAMLPIMYLFGKKLFGRRFYAFCTAFLMMFDFMHFTQTRIATVDVYGTFFIILMYYFMYDYFVNKSYVLGYKASLKPLFLSGLFFGIGAASKWIGVYAAGGLALLFFITKAAEYIDYDTININREKSKKVPWIKDFLSLYIVRTSLYCVLFFVIIPAIIYILSYIPYMLVPGTEGGLSVVINNQRDMLNYHSNLVADHPFKSEWWEWPLDLKPMWFYSGANLPEGVASTIASFGNPAIWWVGIIGIFAAMIIAILKKDKKMVVVFVAIAFQYAPWMFVNRLVFIYHFFSTVPFVIMSIVYVIKSLLDRYPQAKYLVYAYLVVVAALFIIYYPVLSGLEVSKTYIDSLKLLKSWIF